jgi:hypothetical protein
MSFFNSKPWAKIPTDLLENKAMIQAEKELGEELCAAPVLLYLAGATKADEDGIFDIGDGTEFAALIKSKSPESVKQVASIMTKYRIFAHVPESSIYLFAEWEYSTREKGKNLKQRFAIACDCWKKKQEEALYFCPEYTKIDTMRNNLGCTSVECSNTIQPRVNECFNTIRGGENGNPQIRREQIREDETRAEQIKTEVEKTTHTRVEGVGGEISPEVSEQLISSPTSGSKSIENQNNTTKDPEKLLTVPDWKIVPESESSDETLETDDSDKETGDASFVPTNDGKNEGELNNIISTLNEFFSNNNVGYNVRKGLKTVKAIASDLLATAQTPEQASDLARKVCFEFKKMHDAPEGDHWHNIPLYPVYMAKEVVWDQLLSRVSRIYGTVAEPKPLRTVEQAQKDYQEYLADREENGDQMDAEYIRYGIDPTDPHRVQKLFIARTKSTEVR